MPEIDFQGFNETIKEGLELSGLPSTVYLELLFFCFLKATAAQQEKDQSNINGLRDLLIIIQNIFFSKYKFNSFSDVQKRLSRSMYETSTDPKKIKDQTSFEVEEFTFALIIPSLSCELLYLVDAGPSALKTSRIKDLLDVFWTTINFLGNSKNIKLANIIKQHLHRIWNMKILQCLMDVIYYIALLFNIHYQNTHTDYDLQWDYKIATDRVKLFEDHQVYSFLTSNPEHLK